MTIRLHCSLVLAGLLLVGCQGTWLPRHGNAVDHQHQTARHRLIAVDFADALRQLPELDPSRTTVHFLRSARADAFGEQMRLALQQLGYGVRWVDDARPGTATDSGTRTGMDDGSGAGTASAAGSSAEAGIAPLRAPLRAPLFQYRHEPSMSGLVADGIYEIAIGSVEMRRGYALDEAQRLWPSTPMYVRGADARHLQLVDAHFVAAARPPDAASEVVPSVSESAPDAKPQLSPPATRESFDLQAARNPLNPLIAGTGQRPQWPLLGSGGAENVFERGSSNYRDILSQHRVIREQVLTFANDSLWLGPVNKQLIAQMVQSFQSETDVFSVLGCSLGPTNLVSGNAALALGRASRVREALLFAGVPQKHILDEGCWAGDGRGNDLPKRGVVLTLNRRV